MANRLSAADARGRDRWIRLAGRARRAASSFVPRLTELCVWVLTIVATMVVAIAAASADSSAAEDAPAVRDRHAAGPDAPARIGYAPRRGMFLLAAPRLRDPNFVRTVVLLLQYDGTGALGVVVNRPTEISLHDALVTPPPNSADHAVFSGGPVERRRLIALLRSPEAVDGAEHVFADVHASGSFDTLRRMLEREEHASDLHAFLGYAGWAAGQLDAEIARGDWIVTPADTASIFDTPPDAVWRTLMRRNAGRWVRAGPAVAA